MDINYKDIELSKSQQKFLKYLKKNEFYAVSQGRIDRYSSYISFLEKLGLITCVNPEHASSSYLRLIYVLTDLGEMYVRFLLKDFCRTWYPYIVSTIAAIISLISLCRAW